MTGLEHSREAFPVTDPHLDAPDGAVLDLSDDPERWGFWEREGDTWVPVAYGGDSA